jgi:hypothetical protein
MAYKTLGEQRARLLARLGFGAAGATAGANATAINSYLQSAQTKLYNAAEWARLRRYETKQIGTAQTLLDYPTAANPDRITAISVLRSNVWSKPLTRGIDPQDYTYQTTAPSWPQKWEPYAQIEIFPQTDQIYSLRIFYIMALAQFADDGDRSIIDDELIFIEALARAKAHYRHPDAKVYVDDADALLVKLKGQARAKTVFKARDYTEQEPLVKPQTV